MLIIELKLLPRNGDHSQTKSISGEDSYWRIPCFKTILNHAVQTSMIPYKDKGKLYST
jgi:hypothetical protein